MALDSIIIGAGISGLTAAFFLKKAGRDVLLVESSDRAGGVIQSLDAEGFIIERGPNSLRGTHEFLDLAEELGMMGELVTGDPKAPAYVYFNDELHPVPMSPPALVKTKLLSTAGKLRLLREPFVRRRDEAGEEGLASFVRRRLGDEILERLVAPFVSGVYAGDAERLSVQASFARLAELEAQSGSLLRGAIKAARAARGNKAEEKPRRSLRQYRLCSFRHGLEQLPRRLARQLGASLLTEAQVTAINRSSSGDAPARFEITFERRGERHTIAAASLIVATPADAAARLLETCAPEISKLVADIPYTPLASVPLAYRREQLARPLDGFGFLAPRGAGPRILGSIWASSLFPERAPDGWSYCTNFIGGETDRRAVEMSDAELTGTAHGDLRKVLGVTGEPRILPITRWARAIPQYVIGHAARTAEIEAALEKRAGLRLVGNYLHGVALGDCIRNAKAAAESVDRYCRAQAG
jgi:protoporphyrinogen/coproporphyrinogen III oxidase